MNRRVHAATGFVVAVGLTIVALIAFGHPTRAQERAGAAIPSQTVQSLALSPWRVSFHDPADLAALAARYDVWSVDHAQQTAVFGLYGSEAQILRAEDRTMLLDLALAARINPPLQAATISGSAGFTCYRTLSETQISMRQLALDYPRLVRTVDYGDSWDETTPGAPAGHDLEALVISNRERKEPKFRMLLIGAIHSRELATAESALRFAERMVRSYGTDPDATWLLDYGELHVAAVANPDGRAIADEGLLWRKNTNNDGLCSWPTYGVDLNRNAPFQWNSCLHDDCSSSDPCSQTYRGASPGSEPEIQALMDYATSIFPDQRGDRLTDAVPARATGLYVSLHSYGRLVLYPWSYTSTPPPNASALDVLARRFGYYNGYVSCQLGADGCLYQADGTLDDWMYGELGIAAYTFELGDWFLEPCDSYEADIAPDVQSALIYGFKAARRPYQAPSGPDVTALAATPAVVQAGSAFILSATVDTSRINPPWGISAAPSALAVRYAIDAPSWLTTTVTLVSSTAAHTESASSANLSASISTADWAIGRHLIFAEGNDGAGHWGVPTAAFVEVVSPTISNDVYLPTLRVTP